ncbi:hypothetical protein BGZ82_008433 [Podila clonocystis]|nr:hypothetical protein BGZ82_008433 [Podila clonocystis]
MYITGGHNGSNNISQTFSLDLSSPWTIAAPKFTKLDAIRSPTDYQIPSALDKDQVSWLLVSRTQLYRYDISDNVWMDPVSNSLLIPNGFIAQSASGPVSSMMQYDITNDKTSSVSMANGPITHHAASVVWSKYLKKLVMFGGSDGSVTFNSLHTYDSSSGWVAIAPTNAGPSPRAFHCAVVANNGTKMVVFGGVSDTSTDLGTGDIYVLDLTTWTWSARITLNPDLARVDPACGATGDYFVSWGGSQDNIVVSSNITLLFNIKTMSWTDRFVPPPSPSPPPPPSPPPEEKTSKVGMIAGIAAGVVVLLAIVGFIFYRRGKRQHDGKAEDGKDGGGTGGATVVPISTIDASHIWQPPTLAQPVPSTPVTDPYALQQYRHQSVYDHHQQPVYDQQQQLQRLSYDQQQSANNWPSPTAHTNGSPTVTGYSTTAYSPYQQQHHHYTDGTQAYKTDEGYIPPPVGGGNFGDEYKTKHSAENPNRASISHRHVPSIHNILILILIESKPSLGGWIELQLLGTSEKGLQVRYY